MICFAQDINTDRPDQSDGTYIIPLNRLQIENGVIAAKNTILNDLMVRYGITNSTELRLNVDAGKEIGSGLEPITFSFKQRLVRQKKWIPAITFVGYAQVGQLASRDFKSKNTNVDFRFAFENELNDQFSLTYNLGSTDGFRGFQPILELGYAPTNKVSVYVEYFGTIGEGWPQHNMDTGVLYLLRSDLQVDLALGNSLDRWGKRFYSTIGISYIFK